MFGKWKQARDFWKGGGAGAIVLSSFKIFYRGVIFKSTEHSYKPAWVQVTERTLGRTLGFLQEH